MNTASSEPRRRKRSKPELESSAATPTIDMSPDNASNHGPYPFGLSPPLRDVEQLLMQSERGRDILAHRYQRMHVITEECSQELLAKFRELKIRADIAHQIRELREQEAKVAPLAMTIEEAARHVADSKTGIRRLIHQRKLSVHPGPTRKSKHRILREELERLFKAGCHKLPP